MKRRVAVLFGGRSTEHEISIISALQAIGYIDRERYDVIPVYITKDNDFYVGDHIGDIAAYKNINALLSASTRVVWEKEGHSVCLMRRPMKRFGDNKVAEVDIAFPIVHGTNVEDGVLQGFLRTLGLPVVGCDVLSSAVGMNKYVMKTVFRDSGIPVLDARRYTWADYAEPERVADDIESAFGYPVIVKPLNLGSSIGISKAHDRKSLMDALELAFEFTRYILAEPAVGSLQEINCAVLGDYEECEASECEEPLNAEEILTFEDKYMSGGKTAGAKGSKRSGAKVGGAKTSDTGASKGMASLARRIPADIPTEVRGEVRRLAVRAFKCLGCSGVARIDFMRDSRSPSICGSPWA